MTRAKAMRRLPLIVLGVLAAALLAGCGGSSGGGAVVEPLTPKSLLQSASASAEATSGRFAFELEMSFTGADEPFAFTGDGAFDSASGRASTSIDMSSFAALLGQAFSGLGGSVSGDLLGDADKWKIEAVQDGLTVYLRFPLVADKLPDGKTWVKLDVSEAARTQGIDLDQLKQFTENDPRKTLDYLRAVAGEIVPVGTEEIRGEETTHYKATIDLLEYKNLVPAAQREKLGSTFDQAMQEAGLRYVPIDLWVDTDGLVRRLTMNLEMKSPTGTESAEMSMTFDLYDYGKPVTIELPDPSDVADASTLKSLG